MPWAQNGSIRVQYAVSGEGPAMLMLHANPFDRRMWLYQMAAFSADYKVIAPDLRGYGCTTPVEEPYTVEDLMDDLNAVLTKENVTEVLLVGASVGARLALQFAITYPKRASGLVLVGGNSGRSPRRLARIEGFRSSPQTYRLQYLKELVTFNFSKSQIGNHLLELFADPNRPLSPLALEAFFNACDGMDNTHALSSMNKPVLVVNGAEDHLLPVGRYTASLIPGAEHAIIASAGHACCLEQPVEFNSLMRKFLTNFGLVLGNSKHAPRKSPH
ncbi:MAG: alpha/beta hydrolase [Pseudorhodobacter sp.]|nr:alpha/beta hydrolase [Pseudorhodobacter sp.]